MCFKKNKAKIKKFLDSELELSISSILLFISRLIFCLIIIQQTANYFSPGLKFPYPSSITFTIITFTTIPIFFFMGLIHLFIKWEKYKDKDRDLLYHFHTSIITALGFITASFFILLTILWTREEPLFRLQQHTYIAILFLGYIIINGYDILTMIQKRIKELPPSQNNPTSR